MKPVAIIGIGCRYPQASGPKAFWELLLNKRDAVTLLSQERRSLSRLFDSLNPDAFSRFYGGFLDGIENFDADFFQVSPREAIHLDPQQRLMMQVVWEALEDAGIVPAKLKGAQAGVFVGASTHEYAIRSFVNLNLVTPYTGVGNSSSILANRISYQLDLRGPSLAVDTACSSSLVAVHLACDYLQKEGSQVAIAGGVNLILAPQGFETFGQANALAANGRCKAFDAKADGFVRSEGAGVVVLKPLEQAIIDGDPIYAVIRGSAVNQDGKTNGLMAPSRWSQEKVLEAALKDAGVDPAQVQYVEAHGTGTLLGDPIEASALGSVLSRGRDANSPLRIGSVKTNIGHTESAAGVAGLIKLALSMKHGTIPASLHYQDPNPYIDFDKLKLRVVSDTAEWNLSEGRKPVAGLSSFGFGGTNAHVLVEQYADVPVAAANSKAAVERAVLFPLSARNGSALKTYATKYLQHLDSLSGNSSITIESLAYNAACNKTHFETRSVFPVKNFKELRDMLVGVADSPATSHVPLTGSKNGVVFVFSGQGSQWHGMASQFLEQEPVFRLKLEECDRMIQAEAGWSVLSELAGSNFENIGEKYQPLLFAVSVALADLWASWGIRPATTVGHSMGEIAAAHVAGMLTLADAVKVICRRSRLMTRLEGKGAMAMVELTRNEAEVAIQSYGSKLTIGASNGPRSVVLTGEPSVIKNTVAEFESKGIFAKQVKTEVACHSVQIDSITDELRSQLSEIAPVVSECRFYSTVHNRFMEGTELTASYWAENVRQPVSFFESVSKLIGEGARFFMELSPHPLLVSQIHETAKSLNIHGVHAVGNLKRDHQDRQEMLKAFGALYTWGFNPEWKRLYPVAFPRERLPTYAWQEQKYWLEEASTTEWLRPSCPGLQGVEVLSADRQNRRMWNLIVGGRHHQYFTERVVQDTPVFPVAGFVEMSMQIAQKVFQDQFCIVRDVEFTRPLRLLPDKETRLQLVLSPITRAGGDFRIHSQVKDLRNVAESGAPRWDMHARGKVFVVKAAEPSVKYDLNGILQRLPHTVDGKDFYQRLAKLGHHYRDSFQGIQTIHSNASEALVTLKFDDKVQSDLESYIFHPAILDACLQGLLGMDLQESGDTLPGSWLKSIGEVKWYSEDSTVPMWCHIKSDPETHLASMTLLDFKAMPIAEFSGIRFEHVAKKEDRIDWPKRTEDWQYDLQWEIAPLPPSSPSPAQIKRKVWLVLADRGGVGEALAARLGDRDTYVIYPGKSFKRLPGTHSWEMNFENSTEYSKLVTMIRKLEPRGARIEVIHLSSLDLKGSSAFEKSRLPMMSILHLLKKLERMSGKFDYRLWVATAGAQNFGQGQKTTNFFQSTVWGLCRSLMEEHHNRFARIVDLSPEGSSESSADVLYKEIRVDDIEAQVAYRNGIRFGPRMVRVPGKGSKPLPAQFKADRTYFLTGGLGKLGKVTAKWMIERGARRLLINGRTKIPPRATWRKIKPSHQAYPLISSIFELEKMGCQIDYRSLDISNYESIEKLVQEYRLMALPDIAGVIHAAGVIFAKPFLDTSAAEFEAVLKPKIDGTWNLHRAFSNAGELDFFVVYSSISAWLSSAYLSVYAAANAFLNGIIKHRRDSNLPGLSMNWGRWADADSAAGSDRKVGTIPFGPGIGILEDLIGEQSTQVGVAVVHWPNFKNYYPRVASSPFLKTLMEEVKNTAETENLELLDTTIRANLETLDGRIRVKKLEEYIVSTIAKAVHCQPQEIVVNKPLNTIGIDSMIALEIKNAISRDVGVNVPVVLFLKGITASELAEHLSKNFKKSADLSRAPKAMARTFEIDIATVSLSDLNKIIQSFSRRDALGTKAAA